MARSISCYKYCLYVVIFNKFFERQNIYNPSLLPTQHNGPERDHLQPQLLHLDGSGIQKLLKTWTRHIQQVQHVSYDPKQESILLIHPDFRMIAQILELVAEQVSFLLCNLSDLIQRQRHPGQQNSKITVLKSVRSNWSWIKNPFPMLVKLSKSGLLTLFILVYFSLLKNYLFI